MNIRKRTWKWQGEKRTAWRVDWKTPGGKRMQKQFRARQEAELFYGKLLKERQSRVYGTLVSDRLTFGEFIPIYDQRKPWKSEITRERFSYSLSKVFRALHPCPLLDITEEMIEEIRDRRLKDAAPATVHLDLAVLSDFFAWGVRLRYLERNTMARVAKPALPVKQDNPAEFIPLDDLQVLLGVAGRDACFYKFAAATGIRESELIALGWPDLRDGFVIVRLGKGRKQRLVPLIPEAVEALQTVPRRIGETRVFWWVRTRRQALSRFKRCLEWARLNPTYTFHMLRHSYASFAAMSGVDLKVIAEAMGHTTTTITRRYAHLSPSYQRNEMLKMSSFWRAGTRMGHGAANIVKN